MLSSSCFLLFSNLNIFQIFTNSQLAFSATTINVPDTVGYAVPELYGNFIKTLRERIPNSDKAIWSVHCPTNSVVQLKYFMLQSCRFCHNAEKGNKFASSPCNFRVTYRYSEVKKTIVPNSSANCR